jgi:predicted amidohydrolase
MKLCIAQTKAIKGDIERNIKNHIRLIDLAVSNGAELIIFPELSLTGYEPTLAKTLATTQNDNRLDIFQEISDTKQIIIGVGIPTKQNTEVFISMVIFQPQTPRQTYSKQLLHSDEYPYFVNGNSQIFITKNKHKIAPAICYESLQMEHSSNASQNGANIYFTCVAKSAKGVEKAFQHYPEIAKKFNMTVLMSNCIGQSDDFISVGNSAVWNNNGVLVAQLNDSDEGVLIFDTETQNIIVERTGS